MVFIGAIVGSAAAQTWPAARPISLIVPYAPGGNVDAIARLVAPELGKRIGQTINIDNATGAGGVIGTEKAARAPADGYTLLLSVESSIVIAKLVSPGVVKYDGLADFAPVTLIATSPLVLVGKPELAANNIEDLLKLMRAQPGKISYATSGIGSSLHLVGEMINQKAGVNMVHVPYRAGAQIPTDVMGNQIDLAVLSITSVADLVKTGRIKAFGVSESQRAALLPDVPPLADNPALKGVDITVWQALFAPVKVDPAIVAKLDAAMQEVLTDAAIRDKLAGFGTRPSGLGQAKFAAFLKDESDRFGTIVRTGNIKAE